MPVEKMPVQNRLNAGFNYTSTSDENTAATCSPTEKYHRLRCRFRCDSQNRTIGKRNLPHGRKNISKSRNIGKKNCASVHSWEMLIYFVYVTSMRQYQSVCSIQRQKKVQWMPETEPVSTWFKEPYLSCTKLDTALLWVSQQYICSEWSRLSNAMDVHTCKQRKIPRFIVRFISGIRIALCINLAKTCAQASV